MERREKGERKEGREEGERRREGEGKKGKRKRGKESALSTPLHPKTRKAAARIASETAPGALHFARGRTLIAFSAARGRRPSREDVQEETQTAAQREGARPARQEQKRAGGRCGGRRGASLTRPQEVWDGRVKKVGADSRDPGPGAGGGAQAQNSLAATHVSEPHLHFLQGVPGRDGPGRTPGHAGARLRRRVRGRRRRERRRRKRTSPRLLGVGHGAKSGRRTRDLRE